VSMTCAGCGPPSNYPNVIGTWTGYVSRHVLASGVSNQCLATWSIRTQNGGDFAGSFTTAPIPGDTSGPCAQPADFSGSISIPVFAETNRVAIGALPAETMPGCTLQGQSLLSGFVSVGAAVGRLMLDQDNYFLCGTASNVQHISFDLTRSGT